MPRLLALAVFSLLFWTACTQEEVYDPAPAKLETLKNTYKNYLNHYSQSDVAYKLLEDVRSLAIELNDKDYLAKYYANYAYLKEGENQLGEAVKSYHFALNLFNELNDSLRQANVASNIGNVYRRVNKPNRAINYLETAATIYSKLGNQKKLLFVYENLSLLYVNTNRYTLAEEYIKKGAEVSQELNSNYWIYNYCNLQGELYFRQTSFNEAINSFEKGLTYLNDKQQLEKAYLHGNIGESYMKAGELAKAETWLNEALQIKSSLTDADKRANYNYLGELAVLKGDYKAALNYYDQVVELSASDNELLSEELGTALDAIRDLNNNASVRASGVVIPVEKYSLIRERKDKMLEEQYRLIQSKYDQESIEKAELEIAHLKESEQHKEDIAQFEKKTFTFQLSTLVTALLVVLSCLLIIAIIRKHRKEKRRLAGYESGLQVMMDKYGVSSIAELRELLSRMSE